MKKRNNRFSSMYKKGGEKEQWISDKISTLMDEGKSHDQAVAQALSMSQEMFQEGGTQPYTGKGYGKNMQEATKTIQNNDWYFTDEEKKNNFLNATSTKGGSQEITNFQNAYNTEIQNRLNNSGLTPEERNRMYSETAFTGKGSQSLDGKFGEFTSSRTMPVFPSQSPQTINNVPQNILQTPKLYKVNIHAEDMSDGTRDFQKGSLQAYIKDRTEKQGGLTEEDLQYVQRGIDLSNSEIEAKYNNEDSKNNKKAQERYKKLKQSLQVEEFRYGGELPKYQVGVQQKSYKDPVIGQFYGQDISGGFKGYDANNPITPKLQFPSTTYNPSYAAPKTNSWLPGNIEGNNGAFASTPNFQEKTSQTNVVTPTTTSSTIAPTTTTPQLQPEVKSIFETVPNLKPLTTNTKEQLQKLGKEQADKAGLTQNNQAKTPNFNSNYQDPYQFFNPYGGADIATRARFLGDGIQSKDPFKIITGGLGVGLGVARNVFGGMGGENVRNEAMKNYFDNQYEGITGTPQYLSNGVQNENIALQEGGVFQEGGEQMGGEYPAPQEQAQQVNPEEIMNQVAQAIQQGADPQQIIQQLISMGIPEQEAMQLVQGLIQQMQSQAPTQEQPAMKNGGDYMSVLKGKRIKDYVLNEKTGNYEVTYED